jgi:hypothetical protein
MFLLSASERGLFSDTTLFPPSEGGIGRAKIGAEFSEKPVKVHWGDFW